MNLHIVLEIDLVTEQYCIMMPKFKPFYHTNLSLSKSLRYVIYNNGRLESMLSRYTNGLLEQFVFCCVLVKMYKLSIIAMMCLKWISSIGEILCGRIFFTQFTTIFIFLLLARATKKNSRRISF